MVYSSFLSGLSLSGLSKVLAEKKTPSPTGKEMWAAASLDKMLSNSKCLPVIGTGGFFEVRFEKNRRSNKEEHTGKQKTTRYHSQNVLSGLFICAECGRNYQRVQTASGEKVLRCANRVEHGSRECKSSPTIMEEAAIRFVCETLEILELNPDVVRGALLSITVERGGSLTPNYQRSELGVMLIR